MKLLFVHQYLGALGGAETDILLGAERLRRRGHSAALLYASNTGRNESAWRETFSECFPFPPSPEHHAVRAVVKKLQPDLIYFHSLPDLDVLEALLGCGTPVVRRVHDHRMYCLRGGKYNYFTRAVCNRPASWRCVFPCLAFVGRNPGGSFPVKWVSYLAKQKEIQLNRRCERLVVYSQYQKEELIRNGFEPEKIEVHVPMHGADSTEEHADTRGTRNRVLFVGQVIRGKGVDLLLRALAKVRVPFEARILGDGSHRATCERLSKRLGLADRVRFDGFVPREALASEYAEASLLAVSSVWPEPFGLVGQEAMLHGLPIVGFDAGGIREWLLDGENGFLVPWADTDQFARRIEQLLSDRQLARRLGDQGRNMITRQRAAFELDCPLEQMFARVLRENRTSYQINNTFHSDPQPACV